MIYIVPVVRYLGFDQSGRQPQRFGCQSSQISNHCVAMGVDHPHNCGQGAKSILEPGNIVNYFWGGTLEMVSKPLLNNRISEDTHG